MSKILFYILINCIVSVTVAQSNFKLRNSTNTEVYRIVGVSKKNSNVISVSNEITVAKKLNIQIPNAFSPDGDGVNDGFTVIQEGVEEFNMDIYNRWGELVYQTDKLDEPWGGDYKGTDCIQDAYVYIITARGINDNEYTTYKGSVSLIR